MTPRRPARPDRSAWLPFGAAPAAIALLAVGALLARLPLVEPATTSDRLVLWSFAEPHLETYANILPAFEASRGVRVETRVVTYREIDRRLLAAMWSGRGVPDLVELPMEKIGSFLRGPAEDAGLLDLSPRLQERGPAGIPIADDAVAARVQMYAHQGRVWGFPHDVHPTFIAYRWRDFEELGIDPTRIETWDQFIEVGQRMTRRVRTPGSPEDDRRYMLSIDEVTPNVFQAFLLQRGGDWFNERGEPLLDSNVMLDTLLWYIRITWGPDRIADGAAAFPNQSFFQAVRRGYYVCFLCPDWLTRTLEDNLPGMAGELRLMPMPAWEPGGRRTSTWGGTVLAVTTAGDSEDLAWDLAKHLYVSGETAVDTFTSANILTPFRSAWDDPAFDEPREYWGGQRLGRLFIEHADDVPTLNITPFLPLAQQQIVDVLASCGRYYRVNGEEGFEAFARAELIAANERIRLQIQRNPF